MVQEDVPEEDVDAAAPGINELRQDVTVARERYAEEPSGLICSRGTSVGCKPP